MRGSKPPILLKAITFQKIYGEGCFVKLTHVGGQHKDKKTYLFKFGESSKIKNWEREREGYQ